MIWKCDLFGIPGTIELTFDSDEHRRNVVFWRRWLTSLVLGARWTRVDRKEGTQ